MDPAERAPHRAGPRAARGRGDDLREPAQRHQRRGGHLREVGQRRVPPGLGERAALEPRHRRDPPRWRGEGRAPCRRRRARRRRSPRGRGRADAAHRCRRLPHPARWPGADPEHPRAHDRPGRHRRRRELPGVRRRACRPRPCARHRREREGQPAERVQRGRDVARARGGGRRVRAPRRRGAGGAGGRARRRRRCPRPLAGDG